MISVDGTRNAGPVTLDGQNSSNIVSSQLRTSGGIQDCQVNAKEGKSGTSRFGGDGKGNWRNQNTSRFRLPISVDNGDFSTSDFFMIPEPSFRIDGFTDTAQDAERVELVGFHVLVSQSTQGTNGRRSSVELSSLMLINCLPISSRIGIRWNRFEDNRCRP